MTAAEGKWILRVDDGIVLGVTDLLALPKRKASNMHEVFCRVAKLGRMFDYPSVIGRDTTGALVIASFIDGDGWAPAKQRPGWWTHPKLPPGKTVHPDIRAASVWCSHAPVQRWELNHQRKEPCT